jgi:hypothetical protein
MKDEEKMTFRPFHISFDWLLTSPGLHWKQQKYPFLMVLATLKIGKFFVIIFFHLFFPFLLQAILPIVIFIDFFGRLLKILKHCQLI